MADAIGVVYPLYAYPSPEVRSGMYADIAASAQTVATTVIINPDDVSCPPTTEWADVLELFRNAPGDIRIIAYVPSSYGQRDICDVHADIETYRSCYDGVEGIFVDEGSNDISTLDYFLTIAADVKQLDPCVNVGGDTCASSSLCAWDNVTSTCLIATPLNMSAACPEIEIVATTDTPEMTTFSASDATTEEIEISTTETSDMTTVSVIGATTIAQEATASTSASPTNVLTTTSSGSSSTAGASSDATTTTIDITPTTTIAANEMTTGGGRRRELSGGVTWSVWLNPGTFVASEFLAAADTIVQFEANFDTFRTATFPSYLESYERSRTSAIVLNTKECDLRRALEIAANSHVGWALVLDPDEQYGLDRYVKPSLPTYWNDEVATMSNFSMCVSQSSACGLVSSTCCAPTNASNSSTCNICNVVDAACPNSGSASSTDMIIGVSVAGFVVLFVGTIFGLFFWKRASYDKKQADASALEHSRDLNSEKYLREGSRIQVVSKKHWHDAVVLHVHSDGRVTCRRTEDNKIARLVPRTKIRFNGIRLSETTAPDSERYDVVRVDSDRSSAAASGDEDTRGASRTRENRGMRPMNVHMRHSDDGDGPIYSV